MNRHGVERAGLPAATAFSLAIDAAALAHDRRGMGRLVRGAVRVFARDPGLRLTLLAARRSARTLADEFPGIAVQPAATARRAGRYDAVWFPFNGMRFVPAAPAVVTMHDAFAFTQPHPERIARFREQAPMRRAARRAARIAVDSQWTYAEVVRELRPARCEPVVIAPVPDAFFFPAPDDSPPPPLDALPFVLLVGVREPRKNASMALAACARALRGAETLVIVGQLSPHDRELAQRSGLRCGEIAASDGVLRALYRNAALVLVPSLAEGFGLIAVEALACGVPVLASSTTALPQATGSAALLLDPHDAALWARKIRMLLDEPERAAQLRARARAQFARSDREAFARATLALLRESASTALRNRGHQ